MFYSYKQINGPIENIQEAVKFRKKKSLSSNIYTFKNTLLI